MPIVSPTSGRKQHIGQDAAENERNSNQKLQNRIHHGFLHGINYMLKPDSVGGHILVTLTCDVYKRVRLDYYEEFSIASAELCTHPSGFILAQIGDIDIAACWN
jgi:hypothetical protein